MAVVIVLAGEVAECPDCGWIVIANGFGALTAGDHARKVHRHHSDYIGHWALRTGVVAIVERPWPS